MYMYMYVPLSILPVWSLRALARNCDAPVDDKKGGSAKCWKNGKPVRVVGSL